MQRTSPSDRGRFEATFVSEILKSSLLKDPTKLDKEGTKEELIKRVDDQMFVGERRHYERFKDFDYDRDGYVSTNDIRKTFMAKNLMDPSEVEKLVGYLDEKGDGFVDFRSFNKKIKNNMTNTNEHGQAVVRNIMQPSSEHVKLRIKQTASMRNTISSFKEPFKPTNDKGMYLVTQQWETALDMATRQATRTRSRLSSTWTAPPRCTRARFTLRFLPDSDRHKADSASRTSYQREDMSRKKNFELARLEVKRCNSQQIATRIAHQADLHEEKHNARLMNKGVSGMLYQHVSIALFRNAI